MKKLFVGINKKLTKKKTKAEVQNFKKIIHVSPTDKSLYSGRVDSSYHYPRGSMNYCRIPVDPLTGTEYAYSTTYLKSEFQVGATFEGVVFTQNNLTAQAVAGNRIGSSYLNGDYNGQIIQKEIAGVFYVLAVPTIINADMIGVSSIGRIELLTNLQSVYTGTPSLAAIKADGRSDSWGNFSSVSVKKRFVKIVFLYCLS